MAVVRVSQVKVDTLSLTVHKLLDVPVVRACKLLGSGWAFLEGRPTQHLSAVWDVTYNGVKVARVGVQPCHNLTGVAYTHLHLHGRSRRVLHACTSVVAWRLMHALWPTHLGSMGHAQAPLKRQLFMQHVRITRLDLCMDVRGVDVKALYSTLPSKAWADRAGRRPLSSKWVTVQDGHGRSTYYYGARSSARQWCIYSKGRSSTRIELRLKGHAHAPLDASAVMLGRNWAALMQYDAPHLYTQLQACYPDATYNANAPRANAYANLPLRRQKRGAQAKIRDVVATVCHVVTQYRNVLPLLLAVLLMLYGTHNSTPVANVVALANSLQYKVPRANKARPASLPPMPMRHGLNLQGVRTT